MCEVTFWMEKAMSIERDQESERETRIERLVASLTQDNLYNRRRTDRQNRRRADDQPPVEPARQSSQPDEAA
jgi:hypothetical protein